jgi:hypothetical protein
VNFFVFSINVSRETFKHNREVIKYFILNDNSFSTTTSLFAVGFSPSLWRFNDVLQLNYLIESTSPAVCGEVVDSLWTTQCGIKADVGKYISYPTTVFFDTTKP